VVRVTVLRCTQAVCSRTSFVSPSSTMSAGSGSTCTARPAMARLPAAVRPLPPIQWSPSSLSSAWSPSSLLEASAPRSSYSVSASGC